jgi:alpha-glucosidase
MEWWKTGVVYQVYPRSVADADGDGVGDLRGILGRLDYLSYVGVDALWLSPIYPSPMADFGYDISDYKDVDPVFGTLEDFDALVEEAHRRGIRVILDYVPNHTSDEHPWFVESRSSRDNPKRDWYVWRDAGPDGSPPNNWVSYFGGGAWQWDEATGQYYLHLFDPKQADLNWRNPDVREAMYDALRFWLRRGVDGFRIDVLWMLIKDEAFRDNPPNPEWREGQRPWERWLGVYSGDRPEIGEIVREIRAVADEFEGDRVLIGELYLPLERLVAYYGEALDGIHLPFNFGLVELVDWDARSVGSLISAYEAALPEGAWPNWVLGNHDQPRVASRIGRERARLAQMLLLTLRGTPTVYYGDEIGMQDVPVPPERTHDPQGVRNPGFGRDPERTPMQWDAGPNAGFSPEGVEPWLPVADDYETVNVEVQKDDPRSMLSLFRRLVEVRREYPALTVGQYEAVDAGDEDLLAYGRREGESRVLVILNFGSEARRPRLSGKGFSRKAKVLVSTGMDRAGILEVGDLELGPSEGVVLAV